MSQKKKSSEPAPQADAAVAPTGAISARRQEPAAATPSPEAAKWIGASTADLRAFAAGLGDESPSRAAKTAAILSEIAKHSPSTLGPVLPAVVAGLNAKHKRVQAFAAETLPALAPVIPARVAKQLEAMTALFPDLAVSGQDGVVRTFAGMCAASVAYQRRLEPVLKTALANANPKMLVAWTQAILPTLKGEPYANARSVVEARLDGLPKGPAQTIAAFLGVKVRHRAQ